MTETYGFLAYPATHSLSPLMHNAGFKALQLDAEYKFFEVPPKKLNDFLNKMRNDSIKGLNVSKPFKQAIIPLLDEIDSTAKFIGAVNTIINREGVLRGANVDWIGVYEPLEEVTKINGSSIVILGAGGASRAAIYALQEGGAREIVVLNRTKEKAEELVKEFSCTYGGGLEEFKNFNPDIVIQATSAGLNDLEGVQIVPKECIKSNMVIFEMIYSPLETKIVRDAREIGATVITGDKMLLHQGYKAFELWTSVEAPRKEMAKALNDYFHPV